MSYKLRVDANHISLILPICKKFFEWYICSHEGIGTDNSHLHLHLKLLPTKREASLRQNIRKEFGSGNGSYSLKQLDDEFPVEYVAYLLKEDNYQHSDNYPKEWIQKAKAYDSKVKKEMKEKKSSRLTIIKKIERDYFSDLIPQEMQHGTLYVSKKTNLCLSKQDVVQRVIAYYKDTETLVRQFMVVSLCQTLCLKYVAGYEHQFFLKVSDYL